jgi:hypothetical protein
LSSLSIPFPVLVLILGCLVLENDTERLSAGDATCADLLDKMFSLAVRILSPSASDPLMRSKFLSEYDMEVGIGGGRIEGGFGMDWDRLVLRLWIG